MTITTMNSVRTAGLNSPASSRFGTCDVPTTARFPKMAITTTASAVWKNVTPKAAAKVVVFLFGAVAPIEGSAGVRVSMQKQG